MTFTLLFFLAYRKIPFNFLKPDFSSSPPLIASRLDKRVFLLYGSLIILAFNLKWDYVTFEKR